MTTEPHQPEETSDKKGFGKRQIIATVLTLGVLVLVFAVVFPQFAVDCRGAFDKVNCIIPEEHPSKQLERPPEIPIGKLHRWTKPTETNVAYQFLIWKLYNV